ncbi:short-chain dehydrogenase TIC 32 [Cucumis melo var. makuwa]|uniref:Short-chain dehydrogenase TIC 32 n=1 Tax=Cucumis melo var. makuwa TaxID=1194695 RepID=A0A5D3CJT3_CUCMM|nr:short-chain dehydrogenase TIC 32 [Cucumis melo var. makuwa]
MLEMLKYLVGSAGASGYGSNSTAEEVTQSSTHLNSITAIVTGATSGIGEETARVLAKRGARIVIPARNLKAAEEAKARIVSELECFDYSRITVMVLDLSSLNSVMNFVSEFEALNLPLNLLMSFSLDETSVEQDDRNGEIDRNPRPNSECDVQHPQLVFRRHIRISQPNKPELQQQQQVRLIRLSLCINGALIIVILIIIQSREYDATRAYSFSKLANLLHTVQLAHRLQEMKANVTVNCVHPGVVRTNLNRDREGFLKDLIFFMASKSKLLKTIPQSAATSCYVATHRKVENVNGKYFEDCNEQGSCESNTKSAHLAERLWSASEIIISNLTGNPQP